MTSRQHVVTFRIDGDELQLTVDEAREVTAKLRQPDSGNPHMADAQVAAAVFIERLAEEVDVTNPPLQPRELRAIGLALTRLEISDGVSVRQQVLRDAIFAHELG